MILSLIIKVLATQAKFLVPSSYFGGARGVVVIEGARGVIVIVVGNGHGDTSSNPGRD